MDQKRRLFDAADAIVDEGRTPTLEAVRERLGGGSFSSLGPLYDAWSKSRGHHPRPTRKDLPTYLVDRLATVAAEIWCEGRRDHANEDKQERDEIARERDHLRSELEAARSLVDALERRLRQEDEVVEGVSTKAPAQPRPVSSPIDVTEDAEPKSCNPRAAEAFWARVMQEVLHILGRSTLSFGDIFKRLNADTAKAAAGRDKAWSPGRLAYKMRKKPDLFTDLGNGQFRTSGQSLDEAGQQSAA